MSHTFPKNSRVWVYQSNRFFTTSELETIRQNAEQFVTTWQVHGKPLHAGFDIIDNLFVVLIVNESINACSGCSIDSSVQFIKAIESEFNVEMMDRMCLAYKTEEGLKLANMNEFTEMLSKGIVSEKTIVYNNLVNNLSDFENKWEVPVSDSWHKQLLQLS